MDSGILCRLISVILLIGENLEQHSVVPGVFNLLITTAAPPCVTRSIAINMSRVKCQDKCSNTLKVSTIDVGMLQTINWSDVSTLHFSVIIGSFQPCVAALDKADVALIAILGLSLTLSDSSKFCLAAGKLACS